MVEFDADKSYSVPGSVLSKLESVVVKLQEGKLQSRMDACKLSRQILDDKDLDAVGVVVGSSKNTRVQEDLRKT